MSDEYVIASERIYSDPEQGPVYVVAYEGQQIKRSVLEALGYKAPEAKKRGKASVEDKAIKPADKSAE